MPLNRRALLAQTAALTLLSTSAHASGFSAGAGYSAAAVAFFNRLATAPTEARAKQYDVLFRSLVDNGVWPLLDALWVLAAADAPTALLNLKSTSHSLTAVNSPTFEADRGYTGDGATSYLAGPNLSSFGGQYALDSCHMGCYVGTDTGTSASGDIGQANAFIIAKGTSSISRFRANDGTTSAGPAAASSIGHFAFSRAASTGYTPYKNGTAGTLVSVTSTAISNAAMRICGAGAGFAVRQMSAAHVGGALTAAQVGAMNAALATYLQSVGAPVA